MPATRLAPAALKRALKEHRKRKPSKPEPEPAPVMVQPTVEAPRGPGDIVIGRSVTAKIRNMRGEVLLNYAKDLGFDAEKREDWEKALQDKLIEFERTTNAIHSIKTRESLAELAQRDNDELQGKAPETVIEFGDLDPEIISGLTNNGGTEPPRGSDAGEDGPRSDGVQGPA